MSNNPSENPDSGSLELPFSLMTKPNADLSGLSPVVTAARDFVGRVWQFLDEPTFEAGNSMAVNAGRWERPENFLPFDPKAIHLGITDTLETEDTGLKSYTIGGIHTTRESSSSEVRHGVAIVRLAYKRAPQKSTIQAGPLLKTIDLILNPDERKSLSCHAPGEVDSFAVMEFELAASSLFEVAQTYRKQ